MLIQGSVCVRVLRLLSHPEYRHVSRDGEVLLHLQESLSGHHTKQILQALRQLHRPAEQRSAGRKIKRSLTEHSADVIKDGPGLNKRPDWSVYTRRCLKTFTCSIMGS